MSIVLTQGRAAAEFILSEANGNRSRENATIVAGVAISAGQVLGRLGEAKGAASVGAPSFTGTGNGVLTKATPAFGPNAQVGEYQIVLSDEGANAGDFLVLRPDGTVDGVASVGVAYDKDLRFTIADGATDFASPAVFKLTVTKANPVGVGEYDVLDAAATDGTDAAAAIAIYNLAAAETNRGIAIIARDCTVNGKCLEWPVGITNDQKNAALKALAAQGIIVRT